MWKSDFFRDFLVMSIHDKNLKILGKRYLQGDLIDIGCGSKPYLDMFKDIVRKHVGIDHESCIHDKQNIDLFGSAYQIPVNDKMFDSAICTAVLEHLELPHDAIRECSRVLKDGGHAIYSIPHIWHLHEEPRDFFRYTKYGLEFLFQKNGFNVIEILPLSGFWVTIGQCSINYLERFNKSVLRYFPIFSFLYILIAATCYILDKVDKAERWTWMYMVVAQKKSS